MFASKNSMTKEINLLGKKIRKVELLYNKTKKNLRKDQDNYQNICLHLESSKKNLNEVINKNVFIYKKEKISKFLERKKKVTAPIIVNPKGVTIKNATSKKGILKKTTVNEGSSNTKQVSPKNTTKKVSSNTKQVSPKKTSVKKGTSNTRKVSPKKTFVKKGSTNTQPDSPKKMVVEKLSQPKSTKNNGSADKTGVLKPKIVKALSKWADKAKKNKNKNKNSEKKTDKTGNNKDKKEGEIPFIVTDKGTLKMKSRNK